MKLKTKNKSKTKLCCDCFLRSNVLFLAFTRVHSLIHAHNQIKSNQTKPSSTTGKKTTGFFYCLFSYEKCVPRWFFYYFLFFCFANFVCIFSSCLISFFPVRFVARSRFHKDSYKTTIVRLCVCGVAFLRFFFIVLVCWFFLLGVYLCLLSCVLLQYQIATMVQILQINLICFFLFY